MNLHFLDQSPLGQVMTKICYCRHSRQGNGSSIIGLAKSAWSVTMSKAKAPRSVTPCSREAVSSYRQMLSSCNWGLDSGTSLWTAILIPETWMLRVSDFSSSRDSWSPFMSSPVTQSCFRSSLFNGSSYARKSGL